MLRIYPLRNLMQHPQQIPGHPEQADAPVIGSPFHPGWLDVEPLIEPVQERLDAHTAPTRAGALTLVAIRWLASVAGRPLFDFNRPSECSSQAMMLTAFDFGAELRIVVSLIAQPALGLSRQVVG